LIQWINNTFKLSISRIEEACTGAIYCQIIEAIHPGEINLHKVNWKAKLEHEYLANYKLLQQAFNKVNINKNIETEKLIKGRAQDNLEFLQFLKRYFEIKFKSVDYDPIARRKGADFISPFNANQPSKSKDTKAFIKKDYGSVKALNKENEAKKENLKSITNIQPIVCEKEELHNDKGDIKNLRGMVNELEAERDFYLSKLRDMEFFVSNCDTQKVSSETMKKLVLEILFSKVEVKVQFDENGQANVKTLNEISN
jgi:RP/EB family microtubule-associated protein